MQKILCLLFIFVLVAGTVDAQNLDVAKIAKSLNFSGTWKVNKGKETQQLRVKDYIAAYNGAPDYPAGSGYQVGECKTFARIIVQGECGYRLPAGYNYAKHPLTQAQPGYILQKPAPKQHTMIVVATNKEEIKVLHANYGAHHRIHYATFARKWLKAKGYKVFKPGQDKVAMAREIPKSLLKYPVETRDRWGTWRIVITGEVPYHRVGQGTIVSHSGPGPCKIVVQETRSVSNTYSVECGVSAEVISAKVGFSVTKSFSRALSFWKEVPQGKYGYVDLYYKYMVKKFAVYYKPLIGSEYKAGNGEAWKFQAVEFQYRESSN